ncbi:MAG TPA: hypothetical protein VIP28_10745 [Nocardioides sp.]
MSEPITNLSDAVRELGALPMPVGPEPQVSEAERLRAELTASEQRSERRRIAWRMAYQRAQGRGWAADRAGERAREGQTAMQDMLASLLAMQIERDAALERVAELLAERRTTNEALDDAVQELRARREGGVYPQGTAQRVQQREKDDPARCLTVHPFSPRDGWRMVCGSCDHGKNTECHRVGGA